MDARKHWIKMTLGALTLAAVVIALPSTAGSAPDVKHPVATLKEAKTRSDHERLAVYYEVQAKDLEAKAVEHEQMAKVYDSDVYNPVYRKLGYGQHCIRLVSSYRQAAQESTELAKLHRKIADETAK